MRDSYVYLNPINMPLITTTDLETCLYPEIIEEITRADETITERAIATAIGEAKMYLGKFDLVQLFGDDSNEPELVDAYLVSLLKDLACWHLLRLSNTGADQAVYRTAYTDAISALKSIMSGQAQPQGWRYMDTSTQLPPAEGDAIDWSSNQRRNNFW
jgi:hypothetical protein